MVGWDARESFRDLEVCMQKRFWIGLVLLGALVVVAVSATTGSVSFDVFGLKWTMKTVYALLGSAVVGIAAGAMVRP